MMQGCCFFAAVAVVVMLAGVAAAQQDGTSAAGVAAAAGGHHDDTTHTAAERVRWQQPHFAIGWCPWGIGLDYPTLAGANFTIALQGADAEQCKAHGLGCIGPALPTTAGIDDHESFWGYNVIDEPGLAQFPAIAEDFKTIRRLRPGSMGFANLLQAPCPSAYLAQNPAAPPNVTVNNSIVYPDYVEFFASIVKPDILSMDYYPPFEVRRQFPMYSPHIFGVGSMDGYLDNVLVLRDVARRHNISSWWNYFGANHMKSEAQMKMQMMTSITVGGRGLIYWVLGKGDPRGWIGPMEGGEYTWSGPDLINGIGRHWAQAKRLNSPIVALGPTLMKLQSQTVVRIRNNSTLGLSGVPLDLIQETLGCSIMTYHDIENAGGNKTSDNPKCMGNFEYVSCPGIRFAAAQPTSPGTTSASAQPNGFCLDDYSDAYCRLLCNAMQNSNRTTDGYHHQFCGSFDWSPAATGAGRCCVNPAGPLHMQVDKTAVHRVKVANDKLESWTCPRLDPSICKSGNSDAACVGYGGSSGEPIVGHEFLLGFSRHQDGRDALTIMNFDMVFTASPTLVFAGATVNTTTEPTKLQLFEVDPYTGREMPAVDGMPALPGFQVLLDVAEARVFLVGPAAATIKTDDSEQTAEFKATVPSSPPPRLSFWVDGPVSGGCSGWGMPYPGFNASFKTQPSCWGNTLKLITKHAAVIDELDLSVGFLISNVSNGLFDLDRDGNPWCPGHNCGYRLRCLDWVPHYIPDVLAVLKPGTKVVVPFNFVSDNGANVTQIAHEMFANADALAKQMVDMAATYSWIDGYVLDYENDCGNYAFCHAGPQKNDTACDLSRATCAAVEAALLAEFFQTLSTALHAKGKTIGFATNSVTGAGFEHWQYYQSYLHAGVDRLYEMETYKGHLPGPSSREFATRKLLEFPLNHTAFGLGDYDLYDTVADTRAWLNELKNLSAGMPGQLSLHVYDLYGAYPQSATGICSHGCVNRTYLGHCCARPEESWWAELERFATSIKTDDTDSEQTAEFKATVPSSPPATRRTPPLGWTSWATVGCSIDCDKHPDNCLSERVLMQMMDAVEAGGWKAAGYTVMHIDDCAFTTRDARGELIADPKRFTNGSYQTLAAYAHSKGLLLGAYLDMGNHTCDWGHALPPKGDGEFPDGPGSYMHEATDVSTLARWGVDQIKVDGCYRPDNTTRYWDGYSLIAKAIAASGRDIILACEAMMYMEHDGCSHSSPADPKCAKNFSAGGPERLAAYRRLLAPGQCNSMTVKLDDVQNYFLPADPLGPSGDDGSVSGILDFFGDNQDVLASQVKAAGPGHYNDPEWVLAGTSGQWMPEFRPKDFKNFGNRSFVLTPAQTTAQFALYSLLSTPLLLGLDFRRINQPEHAQLRALLQNAEILAINQDALSLQGRRLRSIRVGNSTLEVWAKELAGGGLAVVLFNHCRAPVCSGVHTITVKLSELGVVWQSASARDLINRKDKPQVGAAGISAVLGANGVALFKLTEKTHDGVVLALALVGAKSDDVSAAVARHRVTTTGVSSPPLRRMMGNFSGEEIVDVTAFGARGDGHTDDTAAIQAALDAGVGKLVFFPHTGRSESRDAAYVISATLETSKDGPVAILGGSGTEESVFIIWNGPTNGTMLRWNSGWSRMTGVNLYSGSSLPGIILHIGYNPSRTAVVSIEDVEFEHCVFGGGEYFGGHNATALSGGGRIAGVKLGSFDLNGLDDDVATVKFRHCRFDTNYDGILFQSTNALNIDFDSCVFHKARNQFHNGPPGDHDVRSHVRMVRGGGASFTNPYFGCLGDAGLADAAIHIWSGWVSVTKAECESSTGGGGFLWLENNTVAVDPYPDPYNGKMNTTMRNIHEVMRPSVVTASRIDAKAIFGKGASIVLSPGSSPLVLVGNWMNYRDDAETSLPWVKIESGAATSFVTSIGNTFWSTRSSPFDIQSPEGRLISSGDMITADYGRTLTPLAALSSHVVTVRSSPYRIGGSFDDFQVDSSAGAANVTLPPARLNSGRKLTVTHTAGGHEVLLYASLGDAIAGTASVDMSAMHDSITLHSDGGQQWQIHAWSSPTPRVTGGKRWLQVAPGSFMPVWDAPDLGAFGE